jgi:translation initiation factor IF-2
MEPGGAAGPSGGAGATGRPGGGLMQAWKAGGGTDGMDALRQEVNKAAASKAAAQAAAAAAAAAARAAAKRRALGGVAAELAGQKGPPPLPFQLKEVLSILREADGHPRSFQELGEQLPAYDFSEGGPLRGALLTNALVAPVPGGVAYRSEHGIRSKDDLLRHVRTQPAGLPAKRFKDAYRSVVEDAERLRGEAAGLAPLGAGPAGGEGAGVSGRARPGAGQSAPRRGGGRGQAAGGRCPLHTWCTPMIPLPAIPPRPCP